MGTPALDIPSLVHKYVDLNVRASWFEKEVPRHEVWVDAFRMARTPVTVQQFNRFRSAIGEETDSHSNPDWPVSGVPHPAAVEYCVWMAKRLGLPIRLPTEVEWERAARGDDVRETPWNGPFTALCGNLAETGLGGPAPVGSFPLGASPFGVLDMVGNVDEWTSTVYAPYPGAPDSVPAEETWAIDPHVCRGGYWATGRDLARCSRRHAAYYESLPGRASVSSTAPRQGPGVTPSASRIAIIGNGGGGKSTLARRVAATRRLPCHSVDQVQWLPGWTPAPSAEVVRQLADWVATPRWVIDGWGPWNSIADRLRAADTVIFVDLPLWQHYWLASERLVAAATGVSRADPVEGCDDLDARRRLFETIDRVDRELLPALRQLIDSLPPSKEIIRVTDVQDLVAVV